VRANGRRSLQERSPAADARWLLFNVGRDPRPRHARSVEAFAHADPKVRVALVQTYGADAHKALAGVYRHVGWNIADLRGFYRLAETADAKGGGLSAQSRVDEQRIDRCRRLVDEVGELRAPTAELRAWLAREVTAFRTRYGWDPPRRHHPTMGRAVRGRQVSQVSHVRLRLNDATDLPANMIALLELAFVPDRLPQPDPARMKRALPALRERIRKLFESTTGKRSSR
jgi:hypothetical protein